MLATRADGSCHRESCPPSRRGDGRRTVIMARRKCPGWLDGTVDATKPFKAAQVFLRTVDTDVLVQWFTQCGPFSGVAMPATMRSVQRGPRYIVQKTGHSSWRPPRAEGCDAGCGACGSLFQTCRAVATTSVALQSYDEVYPRLRQAVWKKLHGPATVRILPDASRNGSRLACRLDLMMGMNLLRTTTIPFAAKASSRRPPSNFSVLASRPEGNLLVYFEMPLRGRQQREPVRSNKELPLD